MNCFRCVEWGIEIIELKKHPFWGGLASLRSRITQKPTIEQRGLRFSVTKRPTRFTIHHAENDNQGDELVVNLSYFIL